MRSASMPMTRSSRSAATRSTKAVWSIEVKALLLPPFSLDDAVELALGELVGRLEHQVLEEVRECPTARRDRLRSRRGTRPSA